MNLKALDLTMQYNDAGRTVEVFRELSLEIASGTSVAITGESGVGKSTLLYILGALEFAVSGDVILGNVSYNEFRKSGESFSELRGKYIGLIFQFHHLLPEFSALENVQMPMLIQGISKLMARERATELLDKLKLSHRLEHRPGALSGGEQQRVAIARAFANRPGIVLADEPTGNLDVKTAGEVTQLLLEMQEIEGTTLVVVTHSKDLAKNMNRIVELTPEGLMEC